MEVISATAFYLLLVVTTVVIVAAVALVGQILMPSRKGCGSLFSEREQSAGRMLGDSWSRRFSFLAGALQISTSGAELNI